MADDVAVTAGAGTAIATQDRSSRHFQQVIPAGADTIASGRVTVTTTAAEAIATRSNRVGVLLIAVASNTAIIDVGDTSTAVASSTRLLTVDESSALRNVGSGSCSYGARRHIEHDGSSVTV